MRRGFYRRDTNEKGITLIALVVTIIILLILAGVAIASVVGDNGLFRKARESVNTWKDAEGHEKGVLDEFSSYLDDNMSNKIKVNYKKTPMKVGEDTFAVQIDFTVTGLTKKEIELASEEEFMESFKKLVHGKSEKEKEEIIDNILKSYEGKGQSSIGELYEDGNVDNLTDLALKMNVNQELYSAKGLDITDGAVMEVMRVTGGAPYYRIESSNKIYQLFGEYVIVPLNENVRGKRNQFKVTENGIHKFKVKMLSTGEEIPIEVHIDEITKKLDECEEGTEYKVINKMGHHFALLSDLEDGKYSTFDIAFVSRDGKFYDISNKIITWDGLSEDFNVEHHFNENGNIPLSYVMDPRSPINYELYIIKDGKKYSGILGSEPE